jgi:hypothetical protein
LTYSPVWRRDSRRRLRVVRSSRELWLWLGGLFLTLFAFLTAIAISYFLKEPGYSLFGNGWMVCALLSFVIAFGAFFAGTKSWAFPPVVRPGFPDITVDIMSIGSTDTERESSTGLDVPAHLRSFHARFVNAGMDSAASLTATMYVKLIAGSWGRAGEAVCPPPTWTLPPSLGLSPMSMPIDIAPGREAAGQLVFEVPRYYLDKVASPPSARLEIADNVTGNRVSIPAELGHYDKAAMIPTPGGAEVLGPEFETRIEPREEHHPDTAIGQA